MAQRRMVSVKIIDSGKFIKMPVSTQALYFHLIARADDDGIVEAFNVMRMTGASEDDLKVLCAKEFVKVLNEDLVAFITDWHEHNLIRSDRKVDSMYQHLLLQVVPEIELKEKKERADRRKLLLDGNGTSHGQTTDGIGKVRLGQDSLGEDNINQDIKDSMPGDKPPDEPKSKKYNADNDPSNKYHQAAVHFAEMVLKANPTCKVPTAGTEKMGKWAREIRLMFESDKRDREHVKEVLTFCFEKDSFWSHTCQSPANFRNNYDKIRGKMLGNQKQAVNQSSFERSLNNVLAWVPPDER